MKLIDLLIERKKETDKYFKHPLLYGRRIKEAAEALLGEARVYVFGSILRKEEEVPRDIDILIVSPEVGKGEERSRIRTGIWRRVGFSYPFEIHLITPQEYDHWYSHFIDTKVEV